MKNKITTEATVSSLSYYTGTEPERTRKATKTSDRIADVPAEIRTSTSRI
jgi:hypothetical protein